MAELTTFKPAPLTEPFDVIEFLLNTFFPENTNAEPLYTFNAPPALLSKVVALTCIDEPLTATAVLVDFALFIFAWSNTIELPAVVIFTLEYVKFASLKLNEILSALEVTSAETKSDNAIVPPTPSNTKLNW